MVSTLARCVRRTFCPRHVSLVDRRRIRHRTRPWQTSTPARRYRCIDASPRSSAPSTSSGGLGTLGLGPAGDTSALEHGNSPAGPGARHLGAPHTTEPLAAANHARQQPNTTMGFAPQPQPSSSDRRPLRTPKTPRSLSNARNSTVLQSQTTQAQRSHRFQGSASFFTPRAVPLVTEGHRQHLQRTPSLVARALCLVSALTQPENSPSPNLSTPHSISMFFNPGYQPMNTIRIATAQSRITADIRNNGREVRQLLTQASKAKASLVHFPEGALSGYAKASLSPWEGFAWDNLQEELHRTAEHVADLGIWAVLGSCHPLTPPLRPHNSLYILSPHGLHTRYDKQFCSHTELQDWYTPGQGRTTFHIGDWKFGCALCIEIQFPSLFLDYQEDGVDCMLLSSFSKNAMFHTQAQGYAASHNVWFSVSVPVSRSSYTPSSLIGPDGTRIESCEVETSSLVFCDLNREDPRWEIPLQYAKPWRKKARQGDMYRARLTRDPRSLEKSKF